MLGAVSPVLIAYLHRVRPGAGAAAGRLFFTNTLGGLAGGWITALWLIPHTSLRVSLLVAGIVLLVLAVAWSLVPRSAVAPLAVILLLTAIGILWLNRPPRSYVTKYGERFDVVYSHQSGIGLLQVLDYREHRQLLIDGIDQGDMTLQGGYGWHDYIHDLVLLSMSHHPQAKTALQLGLGAGMLPKSLANRGMKITAVDIEPQMIDIARNHFGLPSNVDVRLSDARAFLRHDKNTYDLIFLDTFASESTAWHLLTHEAMTEMRQRLNPGGRLLINTVAYRDPKQPGLDGIEAAVVSAFPQAILYPQDTKSNNPLELINVIIVAGENLRPQMIVPQGENAMAMLAKLISTSRPAAARTAVPTDERNRLDYEQAPLRVLWRTQIWQQLNSTLLWD
jgi:spermidine synthase